MTTRSKHLLAAFALGGLAAACSPKADTATPGGGDAAACTEEAMECPDGSSVVREGPDCEFPACPGAADDDLDDVMNDDADDADAADADDADADAADDDAEDAEDAEG